MKPSSIKKVFGIISYFPNNDTQFHIETRRERSRRFKELLFRLEELWPDVDIMVIAQNWQDFELPDIKNNIITYHYEKLGILGARRELRKRFLDSEYDYLIMLDDDGRILHADADLYMQTIDEHPDGIGVIRHRSCPLMLLAISKSIYSQIDMPDINAEKGEGFEDDIFVASCFAEFPDKAFDFPKGCIDEFSLKYTGPGACPSTWAKEHKLDWDYMRAFTDAKIHALANKPVVNIDKSVGNEPTSTDIDAIITYVNSSDSSWVRDYVATTKSHNSNSARFRSWGTLQYLFRGIATNMPFIRNVVLVVAKPSQVPVWLNKKNVRIVYHKDFIPEKLLPTFNSCTIESFFWNIPDLADRVIYFNDDILPINPTTEEDFFTGMTPHIKFMYHKTYNKKSIYRAQCRSGLDAVADFLGIERYPEDELVCPEHTVTPIVTSVMRTVGTGCVKRIEASATKIRTLTNINQYIYPYYHYFTGDYIDALADFKYVELKDSNTRLIMDTILSNQYKIICLNDTGNVKEVSKLRYTIGNCFKSKLPNKCKYEI